MALIRSSSDPRLAGDNGTYESTSSKYMTLGHLKHKRIEKITDQQKRQWLSKRSENGFVRFYRPSGQQHVTVPLTTQMTALQVCEAFDLDPLYLSIGNQQIKQLSNDNRPLQMQNEILMTLGYSSIQECLSIGGSEHLTHIFCFFTGRPLTSVQHGISNILLVANCLVGRGRILQRWTKKRCILYNDTIRIENETGSSRIEGDEDSILLLNKYRVELADSNHGRCLRLSSSVQKICFVFEDPSDLQLWSAHATQCSIAPNCDLSDRQLLFLPDKLFYVGSQRMITNLNLRRNSLLLKPANTIGSPLIGWLDDVARFPSLRTLNIADNSIYTFPHSVVQLTALVELNLSGNKISILPSNIRMLVNLTSLNLSNNLLTTLPKQLAACQMLNFLDLSFNRFQSIPEVLFMMPKLISWELSGNYINNLNFDANITISINKLDLRLNTFERPLKLTSFFFEAMTVLDLRRAGSITELDLSNLSTIQVIYCSYLSLKTIQVNGTRLREFYAEHNELTQVIVMPIPSNLTILSIAHNSLEFLPEWITDLNKVVTISAHHNQISKLPYRIMMNMSSLRHLLVGNNKLIKLPDIVENCAIEVLNIENNFITKLPAELFKSAHHLRHINLTNNCLTELPAMNSFHDLNRLQTMKLSGNQLTETTLSSIVACRKLRLLDISYNNFRFFNDSALSQLTFLEEINLSGNLLSSLSTEISQLPSLQILRAHSNRITNIPDLSFSKSLKIIDLSNNRLAKLKVEYCVGENLKFLDLTCNPFSDETNNLSIKSERRAISIVDISKRSALSNIQFGFSETPGQKIKQSTQQLRPKNLNDITFAIIDGGSNPEITDVVKSTLKHHLETPNREDPEMLRRAILRTHEDIGKKGNRLGASVFILRIIEGQIMCTSSGHISAMLSRRDGEVVYLLKEILITTKDEYERLRLSNAIITTDELINGVASSGTAIGYTFLYPAVVPNPRLHCINCTDEDDFIVIANRVVWQSLSEREIIEAVKQCTNPLQAAKRLQDMCQAHEQIGNISIIVIKFAPPNKDGTLLRNGGFHRLQSSSKNGASFSPPNYSPISLPIETYQAKPFHLRSFSEQRVNQSTLKNIENRLKKISVAINRIDSDSSGIYYVNPPNANENKTNGRSTLRKIKDKHRINEARLSSSHSESQISSSSNGYILNYDRAIHHQQSPQTSSIPYLLPDIANVGNFSPLTSDTATTSEDSSVFSQEKFQEMTTKGNIPFVKENQQLFGSKTFNNTHDADKQYSNFNLNNIHQRSALSSVQFQKRSSFSKQFDPTITHNYERKEQYLNKPLMNDTCLKFSNMATSNNEKDKKQWDKGAKISTTTTTILSLHIAAYENSVEKNSSGKFDENESLKKNKDNANSVKHWKNVKKIISGSTGIQIPFEFPRQQEEKIYSDPEVMQFKASQRMLGTNPSTASHQSDYNNDPQLVHEHQLLKKSLKDQEATFTGLENDYLTEIHDLTNEKKLLKDKLNLLEKNLQEAKEQNIEYSETIEKLSKQCNVVKDEENSNKKCTVCELQVSENNMEEVVEEMAVHKASLELQLKETQVALASEKGKLEQSEAKNSELILLVSKMVEEKKSLEAEIREMHKSISRTNKEDLASNVTDGMSLFAEIAMAEQQTRIFSGHNTSANYTSIICQDKIDAVQNRSSADSLPFISHSVQQTSLSDRTLLNYHPQPHSGQNQPSLVDNVESELKEGEASKKNEEVLTLITEKDRKLQFDTQRKDEEKKVESKVSRRVKLFPYPVGQYLVHMDQKEIDFQTKFSENMFDQLQECQKEYRKCEARLENLSKDLISLKAVGSEDAMLKLGICSKQLLLSNNEISRLRRAIDDLINENYEVNVKNLSMYRLQSSLKLCEIKNRSYKNQLAVMKKLYSGDKDAISARKDLSPQVPAPSSSNKRKLPMNSEWAKRLKKQYGRINGERKTRNFPVATTSEKQKSDSD